MAIYLILTVDIQDDSVGIPAFHCWARQQCRCSLLDNCWNLLYTKRCIGHQSSMPPADLSTCTNMIALCTHYQTICLERCTTTDL
ncbi:Uncharacterized protein APZ42_027974 [Daphnia magna]|uniref:Uncharacterized protein n=1 Tax=Daphnia magna TaxID=35525 RepID=A0A164QXD4_9CRUS|nr:Uncharacterized protein APZ42_027974 [Daphnia magna]